MKKQELLSWAIALVILGVMFLIGSYFGTQLENTAW